MGTTGIQTEMGTRKPALPRTKAPTLIPPCGTTTIIRAITIQTPRPSHRAMPEKYERSHKKKNQYGW